MAKVIVYNESGKMRILRPSPAMLDKDSPVRKYLKEIKKLSINDEDDVMQYLVDNDLPAGVTTHEIIDDSLLPTDRYFRNVWEHDEGKANVKIDLQKARDDHMERIKDARDDEMLVKDAEQIKDLTDDTKIALVQAEKDTLANIHNTFDLLRYTTLEDIKNAWPVEVPRPDKHK